MMFMTGIILVQKIVQTTIPLIMIIIMFAIPSQNAESSSGNTQVILFTKGFAHEYAVGTTVHLEGQILKVSQLPHTGIAYAHYQLIIVNGTGNPIKEGRTNSQGLFFIDWVATSPSPGISEVNLVAKFSGNWTYADSQSPPLTLTISSPVIPAPSPDIPTRLVIFNDTQLALQVRNGSGLGDIQVNPILKLDSGSPLNTSQVSISVDGNNAATVSSNQWSGDIFVGNGTHKIQGYFPQTVDTKNAIIYKKSINATYYSLSPKQITTPSNNIPTNSTPSIFIQLPSPSQLALPDPSSIISGILTIFILAIIGFLIYKRKQDKTKKQREKELEEIRKIIEEEQHKKEKENLDNQGLAGFDAYLILGLSRNATCEEVKAKHRELIKQKENSLNNMLNMSKEEVMRLTKIQSDLNKARDQIFNEKNCGN